MQALRQVSGTLLFRRLKTATAIANISDKYLLDRFVLASDRRNFPVKINRKDFH
jgi:hypothetical protein